MQPALEHVSDTALLVAGIRAIETERADGFVRDPFAARLAGERGMAIARNLPALWWMQFGIGMRCIFMDELLRVALDAGVDTVLNLGAGLDSRPWRLDLPAALRWIEVDFPDMLAYKSAALGDAEPRCRLERMSADLNNPAERAAALHRAGGGNALLITEGLLMYLPGATIEALAAETRAAGGFAFWLFELNSPAIMERAHGLGLGAINRLRHDEHLEGEDIANAIKKHGWTERQRRTYFTDGRRIAMERFTKMIQSGEITVDPNAPPPAEDGSGVRLYQA